MTIFGGVSFLTPDGKQLARPSTGATTANCTFGRDGVLSITTDLDLRRINSGRGRMQ